MLTQTFILDAINRLTVLIKASLFMKQSNNFRVCKNYFQWFLKEVLWLYLFDQIQYKNNITTI